MDADGNGAETGRSGVQYQHLVGKRHLLRIFDRLTVIFLYGQSTTGDEDCQDRQNKQ